MKYEMATNSTNSTRQVGKKRCIMGDVQVAYVLCLRLNADCKLSIVLSLAEMWQCMKYRQVVKWVEFSMCIVTSFYQSCPLQSLQQTFGDYCVTKLQCEDNVIEINHTQSEVLYGFLNGLALLSLDPL